MTTAEHVRVGVRHPLEPLTAEEIETVGRILTRDRGLAASARFVYVTLREPAKDDVLRHQPGEAFEREAHVVLRERAEYRTYEAIVSLTAGEVRLWRELPGVQPAIMLEEFLATEEAVRKDARWQEAMRRRGITDFDMVMIDPWSVGYNGPEDAASRGRFLRPLTWVRRGDPDDNGYARPVEGLTGRARGEYVRELCGRDIAPGVLAYSGTEVAGWAAVAPRSELPFARSAKIPHVDDLPAWSVWCIRVRPGYRGRGISHVLLDGAVAYARSFGAPAVEGYPVDNQGKKVDLTMAYVGTRKLFEDAGFTKAADTSSVAGGFPRVLMRLDLR